jgi:hypothetical protein
MGKPSRINDVKMTCISRNFNGINEVEEKSDAEKQIKSMT